MNKLTATEIKEIIEKTFNLKFIELKSKSRLPKIVYARVLFAEECNKSGISRAQISRYLNQANHTSIVYYLNRYTPYSYLEKEFKPRFDKLREEIENKQV